MAEETEQRIERLEHRVPETEPEGDLRATLSDVLDEIRVVAAERATVEGEWAEERRQACDLELRRLRELQVRLLFELDELPLA